MSKKTILIYNSTYGSTEKYARWIAKRLDADLSTSKNFKPDSFDKYDIIIYGGSLHAAGIKGFSLITKNYERLRNKIVIVFAVGCSPVKEKTLQDVIQHNFIGELKDKLRLFYFRGAFDYSKMNFIDRTMMKMMRKMITSHKEPLTDDEKSLLDCYESPIDWTNEDAIEPLIDYVKNYTAKA